MRAVFPFLDSLALRFSHDLSVLIRSHELFTLWLHWEKFNVSRRILSAPPPPPPGRRPPRTGCEGVAGAGARPARTSGGGRSGAGWRRDSSGSFPFQAEKVSTSRLQRPNAPSRSHENTQLPLPGPARSPSLRARAPDTPHWVRRQALGALTSCRRDVSIGLRFQH